MQLGRETYPFLFVLVEVLDPGNDYDGIDVWVDDLVLIGVFANMGELSTHCG